jgi:integrase
LEGFQMARPRKDDAPDLRDSHDLTAGLIERLTCPAGKTQAFMRDAKAPGLRVRVTAAGAKSFVFEAKLHRQTIRRTIGDVRAWTIDDARSKANRLRVTLDAGTDPREVERDEQAAAVEKKAAAFALVEAGKVAAVTVGEVWAVYVAERRPQWGERHYQDHINLSKAGGKPINRGTDGRGVTIDMPLCALMGLPLRDMTAPVIEAWAAKEAQTRATSARLAWRLLKVFLGWCAEQPVYAGLLPGTNPAKSKKARESLGKAGVKKDVLQRGQLAAWFAAVQQIQNPAIAAYLQILLLTGARPGEVMTLRWNDVNTQWAGIAIRDKVEGEREIPLTPYVAHLLATLPKRNEWIFSSPSSASGYLTEPTYPHNRACKVAGLEGLTLHGLRRSFKSLTEWIECPAGVVAQLMGHKPSATAEKHYTIRPLELLALHHEKIEAWILEQAGVTFEPQAVPGVLRVVKG